MNQHPQRQPATPPIPMATTPAEARQLAETMIEVMSALLGVIERETELVRAGKVREAMASVAKKTELSHRYAGAIAYLKASQNYLSQTAPELLTTLHRHHDVFRSMLQVNLTVLATAHKAIKAFDPKVPILNARTLTSAVNDSIDSEILVARLSGFFGVVALLLVTIGLYGIMSYIVTGKTQAIGVRVALGAQSHTVLWMILREALTMVAIGILLGIPVALIVGRAFSSMLFGLKSTEPVAIAIVVLVMAMVAAVASYAPARRATKVDPIIALRQE